ncbi:MAG: DEAD/DEAH box helicase family protein, partial [Arenicellales bacterium]
MKKIDTYDVETHRKLEEIDIKLAQLQKEQRKLISEREALLEQDAKSIKSIADTTEALSGDQKVALFSHLFRGREDVFATRWQNRSGRSGYSVACHNEWVPRVCNKPRVKCMDCSHQNFKRLDEQQLYEHLTGKQVIGLYPLLPDSTCRLLAVDFDKSDWQEAVRAVAQACREINIPHAIEISKSGNGAHLWIFFSDPVAAKDARLLGFALLDKAMERYPNLSFESYDRLFPNQDFIPDGRFGNLIALPLQHEARQKGNSLFVDSTLQPYEDQWQFLRQLELLSKERLHEFILESKSNLLVQSGPQELDDLLPWEKSAKIVNRKIDHCPDAVRITLANSIYINMGDLPPPLITRLKRLASFSNPVFFKTQAMRFSTHGIPRYITCAKIEPGPVGSRWLSLPRGCFDDTVRLLEEQDVEVKIDDKRNQGVQLKSIHFLGKLRKDQSKAVKAITRYDTGVLHAPTAFGKTVTAIGAIEKRKTNTLILTHSRQLLSQWQERLGAFLSGVVVGTYSGGKKKPSGEIDIATYQSLVNKKDNTVNQLVQDYGQVIIDECHHISAPSFEMVLDEVRAKYVLGLTATPYRQDGHEKIIFMTAGPIRHHVKPSHSDSFEQRVIIKELHADPPLELTESDQRPKITDVYSWLMENETRSKEIVADIVTQVEDGKHPLVLTERRQHAEFMNQSLIEAGITTVILRGGMAAKDRKQANEQLSAAQVIVATGKYVGEGF